MTLVDTAMKIAIEAHGGDRNKHDGEMYTLHLLRVWINVREAGGDEVQQAIAWLHDAVEDTALTFADLSSALERDNLDLETIRRIVRGVRGMTKIKDETNEEYYHRCRENADSRFVKRIGDIPDNFGRNHKIKDDATKLRMATKYSMGVSILT